MWEEKLKSGDEPKSSSKKVELPLGTGASKVAGLWEQRMHGKMTPEEEEKEKQKEKQAALTKGTFAQKWIQSAQTEEKKEDKKGVELPQGTGA